MTHKQTIRPDTEDVYDAATDPTDWMPESGDVRRVLHERAREHALAKKADEQEQARESYIRFRLGRQEHYGIPYAHVEEIMEGSGICPVPCAPDYVVGLKNRCGEMLTVIDLKEFFRPSRDEDYPEDAQLVVVRAGGMRAGVLVNEVIGNGEFVASELDTPLPARGIRGLQHIQGLYQGEVAILDMESLFGDPLLSAGKPIGAS